MTTLHKAGRSNMQLRTTLLLPNRLSWRQPVSWLLAALLLSALLALNVSSSGITGGDDTGSGIGGTGRTAEPGSGLGGTGLKPFLGFDPDTATGPQPQSKSLVILPPGTDRELALTEQLDLDIPARREIEQAPLPSPVQVAVTESFTRDSSAINISEQIQREIDSNALYFARLGDSSSGSSQTPTSSQHSRDTGQPEAIPVEQTAGRTPDTQTGGGIADESTADSDATGSLTWGSLASYLAEQSPTASNTGSSAEAEQNESRRLERPDRVMRPELPAVQRIRPVQRPGLLPPRIKPLAL